MPQYMIELEHNPNECIQSLESFDEDASDLLEDTYWGCMSGRHAGWVVVNADNLEDALGMVPETLRERAMVTQVDVIPELGYTVDPEAAHPANGVPDAG